MTTQAARPAREDETMLDQQRRAEAVRQLLATWVADESGYDERVWPELKRGLEANRASSRPLFDE